MSKQRRIIKDLPDPEELGAIAEELSIRKAQVAQLEALLRNHYKAGLGEIHLNDIHVENRQSYYIVFKRDFIARKLMERITPDMVPPEWLEPYNELERLLLYLLGALSNRSINKVVRGMERFMEIEPAMKIRQDSGMEKLFSEKPSGAKVFYSALSEAKSERLAFGQAAFPVNGSDPDEEEEEEGDEYDQSGYNEWREGDLEVA